MEIPISEPLAHALMTAIHKGEVEALRQLLRDNAGVAQSRIVQEKKDGKRPARTLLHVANDWPGHFPNVAHTIGLLIELGADLNAPLQDGNAPETPLHWAASSNDVVALDALLDGGADIESPGAIFTGGAPMSDAVVFANWAAARRLLERGAKTTFTQAAALGLLDRAQALLEHEPETSQYMTAALWHGCRGGQLQVAQWLIEKGAEINRVGWDHMTPLDCAAQSGNQDLIQWLREQGAKQASEL